MDGWPRVDHGGGGAIDFSNLNVMYIVAAGPMLQQSFRGRRGKVFLMRKRKDINSTATLSHIEHKSDLQNKGRCYLLAKAPMI